MATKYNGKKNEVSALNAVIALRRSTNALAAMLSKHLDKNQLTGGQFGVLEALLHLGPLPQRDLGKKLLSSKGNITMIIDNLAKRGLVKRVVGIQDRRIANIELTSAGKALIEKIFPQHVKNITQAMSALSLTELEELTRLCKKFGLALQNEYRSEE